MPMPAAGGPPVAPSAAGAASGPSVTGGAVSLTGAAASAVEPLEPPVLGAALLALLPEGLVGPPAVPPVPSPPDSPPGSSLLPFPFIGAELAQPTARQPTRTRAHERMAGIGEEMQHC